ncbi:hypothetical protein KAR91_60100 [Candidatus Pacearchaeota archaeon]|nr:hypothetical protein [Candidatus Pacearchaeota archaeon]
MANEKEKDSDFQPIIKLPIAKRHSVLQDITKQLAGHQLEEICDYGDYKFLMSTLIQDEELWADGIMQVNSSAQAVTTYRLSRVAASIKAINGNKIEGLFEFPDNMNKVDQQEFEASKYGKRTWEMSQMLIWLGDQPTPLIDHLAGFFSDLNKRRNKSLDKLKNSSSEIPGGKSKATSSPEKELSPATQM